MFGALRASHLTPAAAEEELEEAAGGGSYAYALLLLLFLLYPPPPAFTPADKTFIPLRKARSAPDARETPSLASRFLPPPPFSSCYEKGCCAVVVGLLRGRRVTKRFPWLRSPPTRLACLLA